MCALLTELREAGFKFSIDGGKPSFEPPNGSVTAEVRLRIRENREEIIKALQAETEECWLGPGYRCPCGSGRLAIDGDVIRCDSCKCDAFKFVGSSLIRRDAISMY